MEKGCGTHHSPKLCVPRDVQPPKRRLVVLIVLFRYLLQQNPIGNGERPKAVQWALTFETGSRVGSFYIVYLSTCCQAV